MRHLVIGAGNLGIDLASELSARNGQVHLVSQSSGGFDVNNADAVVSLIRRNRYDCIFYCVGYGSVAETELQPAESRAIHVTIPALISEERLAGSRFCYFSSDYAADERRPDSPLYVAQPPRSDYAALKIEAEQLIMKAGRRTTVMRVGSLYGTHKPERTFPGKIFRVFGFGNDLIRLPQNLVTPTPTLWLAAMIVESLDWMFDDRGAAIHHCAPRGNVSVRDWAILTLDGMRHHTHFLKDEWYDDKRPHMSNLGCTFAANNWHWHEVWKAYFWRALFMPIRLDS